MQHGPLGRRVRRIPPVAHLRQDRAQQHDRATPLRDHLPSDGAGHQEGAGDVDAHRALEDGKRHLMGVDEVLLDPRTVHEGVDPAVRRHRCRDDRVAVGLVGDVGNDRDAPALRCGRSERIRGEICEHHPIAAGSQMRRRRTTDAGRRPGHDRDEAVGAHDRPAASRPAIHPKVTARPSVVPPAQ